VRIAAIDIGTNSIHMVIAAAHGSAGFDVVDREREVVQVGRGSFAASRLRAGAMRATADALARFVRLARRHQVDRILCTATAAVREARNGGDFLKVARDASGIMPRVIPAEEEGRLVYLAVKSALQLDERPALAVDIGGGSVQLVLGNRERILRSASAPLGALRLTETFLASDPPGRRELARLRRHVRRALARALDALPERPERVYGSSGSIHALACIAHALATGQPLEHLNGHVLALEALEELAARLRRMTLAERERLPGIDAKRAEIIVPGAMVLLEILEAVEADGITLSDFGVREGLVMDYIAHHAPEISALEQVEDLRLRSVLRLLAKFQADSPHVRHVARLALALFDALRSAHRLGAAERELLHFAALLHDVGSVIDYDSHSQHSDYIIRHGRLRGLSAQEVQVVAGVARYHSKMRPRKRDRAYRDLRKPQRRAVKWLAALLRVAEGLDRSHYQLIRSLRVLRRRGQVSILVAARREAQLEIWAARRRTELLAELLDARVRVAPDPAAARARAEAKPAPPAEAPTTRKPRLAVVASRTAAREAHGSGR
jgi:exopolyphosphatase/guanosine-5'-triphosphate,3'-diphosphate pyrophosphatase